MQLQPLITQLGQREYQHIVRHGVLTLGLPEAVKQEAPQQDHGQQILTVFPGFGTWHPGPQHQTAVDQALQNTETLGKIKLIGGGEKLLSPLGHGGFVAQHHYIVQPQALKQRLTPLGGVFQHQEPDKGEGVAEVTAENGFQIFQGNLILNHRVFPGLGIGVIGVAAPPAGGGLHTVRQAHHQPGGGGIAIIQSAAGKLLHDSDGKPGCGQKAHKQQENRKKHPFVSLHQAGVDEIQQNTHHKNLVIGLDHHGKGEGQGAENSPVPAPLFTEPDGQQQPRHGQRQTLKGSVDEGYIKHQGKEQDAKNRYRQTAPVLHAE